ncbi:hypothetical protein DFQ28_004512 [Apophysomyces sp. BC1034]|nr:hypothetical protein DFQ28_004512 [Apophysomyces sp. BC1034]
MSKVASQERMSQILPTVKCSDCGRDVHIRRLGDHLCSSMPPVPAIPILPPQRQGPKTTSPVSPLESPSGLRYDHSYGHSPVRSATPPYYGNARDDYSPLSSRPPHDAYRNDAYRTNDDRRHPAASSPKTPTFSYDRQLTNSSSGGYDDQLPKSPSSFRTPSPLSSRENLSRGGYFDDDRKNEHSPTRKESAGNIYSQSNRSKTGGGGGALDSLMADLMNSMNDLHEDAPEQHDSESCAVCGEEFDYRDNVINMEKKYYHKACFTCRLCRVPLNTHACKPYNDKLYCERDYDVVRNRIMCAGCERPINSSTTAIKALGHHYHPGHIKCYHCYNPLDDRAGYKEYQGRVYCQADFKDLFLPKCRACNKTVEKEAVSAMDGKLRGKWHVGCFACHTCHRPFPDNTFYVYENSPYCKRHYHQLNNSLCRTCDDPIEGPCAQTIEGWRFHPPCFKCNVCRCSITDVYYMFERRIYCESHIQQLQQQRNIRAEKRRTQFGQI